MALVEMTIDEAIDRLCPFGRDKRFKTKWDYIDYSRAGDARVGRTRRIHSGFLIEAEKERCGIS
jgi:hypothetical protein